ncbi:MAG TPA: PadR family transcriptional regulator [Chloroflexota bacterium]|nr:PadR family transcriptional regulator [Chloroflexota bacterium]
MEAETFDWGRFTEPALLILISLAGGAKHGYAMMEDIADFAGPRLGAGTLYGALTRLEARGLIDALPAADRRRPYLLTAAGAALLQARVAELDRCVAIARERLAAS